MFEMKHRPGIGETAEAMFESPYPHVLYTCIAVMICASLLMHTQDIPYYEVSQLSWRIYAY